VGTTTRMEKDIVPESGYRFIGLDIYPIKSFMNILKMVIGIYNAVKIVLKEKPDAIIGFGNYISVPVILAGIILRKKIYLQEQNANIGGTNKFFYRFSRKLFLAFESSYDEIPNKYSSKLEVVGNPLRKNIMSISMEVEREKLKLENDEKLILITGGSLGAKDINDAVIKLWDNFYENKKLRLYWATGDKNYEEVIKKIDKIKANDIIKPYFNNILNIMSAADLVICRAGALTISEIIELEKPSILVPYNSIKVGQFQNAKILQDIEAAYVYKNSEAVSALEKGLKIIGNQSILDNMRSKVKSLKKRDAAQEIADEIDIWGD
ncbi:MAG: UDP-N-acetylglucosamine--N-acetylmuramyl-(pentapeptide) pyrophosphoryl-undecaprenol N-acetylglucosamine transferase, partial [Fusobacteriaceae bacterium]